MSPSAALGVAGVALLFLPELAARRGGDASTGIAFGLGAAVHRCRRQSCSRCAMQHRGPADLPGDGWGMAYGAASSRRRGARHRRDAGRSTRALPYVLSLAYLAVFGSVVAFGAYLTLLKQVGAARVGYVGVAVPVVAMLLSTLFEGYRWTRLALVGVRARAPSATCSCCASADALAASRACSPASTISFFQRARSVSISAASRSGRTGDDLRALALEPRAHLGLRQHGCASRR